MKTMKFIRTLTHIAAHVAFVLACALSLRVARADEPRFKVARQTVDGGGLMRSTGGNFELSGTFAQPDAGVLTGGAFELNGGFWFKLSPTDCDEDGAVGLLDVRPFSTCLTGPAEAVSADCRCLDVDASGTVDLRDAAVHQGAFNNATAPPSEPGLTTVEGFVHAEDGTPVSGAEVRIHDQPAKLAVTGHDGRFIILDVETTLGLIHVKASKLGAGGFLATGAVTGIEPCANGITDAGVVVIAVGGEDLDGDKLPDALEPALGYDPTNPDTDGDGIIDGLEDLDGDGVVNSIEVILGTDLTKPDTDDDFLTDAEELASRTDPLDPDTDADGVIDGEEVEFASDPLSAASLPAVISEEFGHAFGLFASAEQLSAPDANVPVVVAFAPAPVAVTNGAAPPPLDLSVFQAFAPVISVDNVNEP